MRYLVLATMVAAASATISSCGPSHEVDRLIDPARPDAARAPRGQGGRAAGEGAGGAGGVAGPGSGTDTPGAGGAAGSAPADAASPVSGPPDAPIDMAPPVDAPAPPVDVAPPRLDTAPPPMPPPPMPPPPDAAPPPMVDARPPAPDMPPAGCLPTPAADELISNFEDGALSTNMVAGHGGPSWTLVNTIEGATATLSIPEQPLQCGSRRALRFAGMASATKTPIVRVLFVGTGQFYDARAYKGIRFYLRGGVNQRVRMKLPDRNTLSAGGICMVCNDHFGADLDVTPDWKAFTIPFAATTQSGTGDPQPALSVAALFGVEFVVRAVQTFELHIDDVSFFK